MIRGRLLMVALAAGVCGAAAGGELVPFVIPTRPVGDSLIRFSFAPITVNGQRIVVRGGHFYRGRKRIRIWGVNLCFGACFPAHADAERVAERLAAAGVNSVRFHHMDRSAFPRGIWDRRDPTRLSATALDRLDYLIDRLARRGVYANINLHVSRAHSRVLGLPTARKFDKMTDIFTPKLIDAQKRYARDLLTHVNTYRKVRYADDPAVAFVEITNEDSLFMWGADQALRSLPEYYAKILEGKYVVWLKRRYGTTAKLRAAWGRGAVLLGEDMLLDGAFRKAGKAALKPDERGWRLHGHAGCEVKWAPLPKSPDAIRVEIGKADEVEWHIQLLQNRVPIKAGQYYTLSFRALADRARSMSLGLQQAHEPWKGLGLWRRIQLTNTWQEFRIGFPAKGGDENAQLCFNLGGSTVAVQVADVQFRPGGMIGLGKDESLEPGTVALFRDSETAARELDRMHFLADTEKDYFDGMYRFVKNDLGCKALVTGTIVFGPLGLYAQSGMDFIDGHAYWHHPRFPGRPWDMGNWTVEQAAMADHPEQATLFRLAAERLAGKPFTVTEYNHPAPNDYQAECVPMVASFGAAQDWDGIWLFAYNHATDDWDREHFKGFFDIDANPAKWGFVPAGAAIFRDGAVAPLPGRRACLLAAPRDPVRGLAKLHLKHDRSLIAAVTERPGVNWRSVLNARLAVSLGDAAPVSAGRSKSSLSWDVDKAGRGRYVAKGPGALVWVGHAEAAQAPAIVKEPAFGAITLTPLDAEPFDKTSKLLVSACGRCENTGMGFSKDRRTVGRKWGRAPVRIEPLSAVIPLPPLRAGRWRCWALGPDGKRTAEVELSSGREEGTRVLNAAPKYKTMWYLLVREEGG